MFRYSPFQKEMDALESSDLNVLTDVPEGWYIEYKQELPNGRSIAKSLSAFANTYGGWLFFGIKESADGRRVAAEFQGIKVADVPAAEQAIRQAASALVSPPPHFETKVVYGNAGIPGLAEDRAVIVVGIPAGNNAPYVHGTGVIYRRVADSSEPRAETDRHFLDLLWERGKSTRKQFAKYIEKKPKLSGAEEATSSIRICFFPDPWGEKPIRSKLEFDSFAEFMGDSSYGGVSFDNIFTTRNGFIARHVKDNHGAGVLHSWRYYGDCVSEVVLPLSSTWVGDIRDAINYLKGYEHNKPFLKKCFDQKLTGFQLVDLSQLYSIVLSIFHRKKALMELEGRSWNLFYKVQINNFWRRVPFVDLQEMSSFVEKFGIPVVQNKTAYVPRGTDPDSCWEIKPYGNPDYQPDDELQIDATILFLNTCRAMGLPLQAFGMGENRDNSSDSLSRLLRLGARAHEINSQRGKDSE